MIIYEVRGWKRMYQNEDTKEEFCKHFDTREEVDQFEKELSDWVKKYGRGSHAKTKVYQIELPDISDLDPVHEFANGCW